MVMVQSLKELCKISVVVALCTHPKVKRQIFCESFSPLASYSKYHIWKVVLKRVVDELISDCPPGLIKIIPDYFIPLIGIHMLKWANFHKLYFGMTAKFSQNFIRYSFFTSKGTIDDERTARALLKKLSSKSLIIQYKIACFYFLSDIIPILWQKLREKGQNLKKIIRNCDEAVVMWSNYLDKRENLSASPLDQSYLTDKFVSKSFNYGIKYENFAAVKYWWKVKNKSRLYQTKVKDEIEERIFLEDKRNELFFASEIHSSLRYMLFFTLCKLTSHIRMLLFRSHEGYGNMLELFLLQMTKEERKEFMLHYEVTYEVLNYLLYWPYQYLFADTAELVIEILSEGDYYKLLHNVVDLIEAPDYDQTYDYRRLFRELLVKSSPDCKKYILRVESGHFVFFRPNVKNLIKKLFKMKNFTPEDKFNIQLILENASSEDKERILQHQGFGVFGRLSSIKDFEVLDIFLECLSLKEEICSTFKKRYALKFLSFVIEKESIDMANYYIDWTVNPDEVDDFKQNIFSQIFNTNKILIYLSYFNRSSNFFHTILKWFLQTDGEVENWKKNLVFDEGFAKNFVCGNYETECLDKFFEWLDYNEEKISCIKRDMLGNALPDIAERFVTNIGVIEKVLVENILCLCSKHEEQVNEFCSTLRFYCEDCIKQNICVSCRNSDHVIFNEQNSKYSCSRHFREIPSYEIFNDIFNSLLKGLKAMMNKE